MNLRKGKEQRLVELVSRLQLLCDLPWKHYGSLIRILDVPQCRAILRFRFQIIYVLTTPGLLALVLGKCTLEDLWLTTPDTSDFIIAMTSELKLLWSQQPSTARLILGSITTSKRLGRARTAPPPGLTQVLAAGEDRAAKESLAAKPRKDCNVHLTACRRCGSFLDSYDFGV